MKSDNTQNYEDYKHSQLSRASKKWTMNTFWGNLDFFQEVVIKLNHDTGVPKSICCMGIRNGNEYFAFKQTVGFKDTEIYGVDIHENVRAVGPNCFAYDFQHLPKEWEKKFDWVYSNSLDHAFDVKKTLKEWHRICKGYLILSLASFGKTSLSDKNDFDLSDIDTLFDKKLFEVLGFYDLIEKRNEFTVILKVL